MVIAKLNELTRWLWWKQNSKHKMLEFASFEDQGGGIHHIDNSFFTLCLSVGLGWCFTSWDPTFLLGHPCQPNFWPSVGHKLYRSAILAVWFWWSKSSSHSQAGAPQAVPLKVVLEATRTIFICHPLRMWLSWLFKAVLAWAQLLKY